MKETLSRKMLQAAGRSRQLLDGAAAGRIADFVLAKANADGGFRGRAAESDLYYTVFAVESLLALGAGLPLRDLKRYLAGFGDGEGLDLVGLSCLARCHARLSSAGAPGEIVRAVAGRIEECRSRGGYALLPGAARPTVYSGFLAWTALEDLGLTPADADGVVGSIEELRRRDGGYANDESVRNGTTTATSAAVVLAAHLGLAADASAGKWLLGRQGRHGGFFASEGAALPDLLSTATALFALRTLQAPLEGVRAQSLDFVEAHWDETGGFRGHLADSAGDCEYTFYGLLALGCLV